MNNNLKFHNTENGFIRLSNLKIPEHFKKGNLYKELSINNNNNIIKNKLNINLNIPIYFKNEINSIEDLENLLKTYDYWSVIVSPD
jgi:hypothetical protein